MTTNILMPALSPTMEQGKLAKWLKREGDAVKPGDPIAEIETDKATMEVEAVDEGTIAKILVAEGTDNVAVNTPIAVLAVDGEATGSPEGTPALQETGGEKAAADTAHSEQARSAVATDESQTKSVGAPAAAGGEQPATNAKSPSDAPVKPEVASRQRAGDRGGNADDAHDRA